MSHSHLQKQDTLGSQWLACVTHVIFNRVMANLYLIHTYTLEQCSAVLVLHVWMNLHICRVVFEENLNQAVDLFVIN